MSEVFYYKGLYKVKVVTKSESYWIVEALEDFEDLVNGKKVAVKAGERRIVALTELHNTKTLHPADARTHVGASTRKESQKHGSKI